MTYGSSFPREIRESEGAFRSELMTMQMDSWDVRLPRCGTKPVPNEACSVDR